MTRALMEFKKMEIEKAEIWRKKLKGIGKIIMEQFPNSLQKISQINPKISEFFGRSRSFFYLELF